MDGVPAPSGSEWCPDPKTFRRETARALLGRMIDAAIVLHDAGEWQLWLNWFETVKRGERRQLVFRGEVLIP